MKKKIIIITVLALIIITSVIIISQTISAKGEGDEKLANKELYEILWYNIGTPQKDTEMVFEKLSKYTAEKIGATVKMVQFDWGDYTQRMSVITASGEPYDIAFTCSWANQYGPNVERGAFLPLEDLLKTHGQGVLETVNPAFFKGITINDSIYAIPANKELGWWQVFLFNEEIVNTYNLLIRNQKKV